MAGEKLARYMKDLKLKDADLMEIVYGTVLSTSPLRIRREDGLEIPSTFITMSEVARGLYVTISGTKYTVLAGVKAGDMVRMLQAQRSQMYYILERA